MSETIWAVGDVLYEATGPLGEGGGVYATEQAASAATGSDGAVKALEVIALEEDSPLGDLWVRGPLGEIALHALPPFAPVLPSDD